jgi:membrane associated rhomboid family serine protease
MIRFTFFPYFQLYSFTFFWIATVVFVYFYSLYMQEKSMPPEQEGEFMRVSQSVLFELGENYPYYIVKKYHYYRLFTSAVLFRNLYHFLVSAIGILIFGSYIEE